MVEPPDFPRREATPSIAAFPLRCDSCFSGIKAISFVASKKVYLAALARVFCVAPTQTATVRREIEAPPITKEFVKFSARIAGKNIRLVSIRMTGVIKAATSHPNFFNVLPVIKIAKIEATRPWAIVILLIYALNASPFPFLNNSRTCFNHMVSVKL